MVATFSALTGESTFTDSFGFCPNKPVAPLNQTIIYLKGLMKFMQGDGDKGFYDIPVEVPYLSE